jgi:hypothetical protein
MYRHPVAPNNSKLRRAREGAGLGHLTDLENCIRFGIQVPKWLRDGICADLPPSSLEEFMV